MRELHYHKMLKCQESRGYKLRYMLTIQLFHCVLIKYTRIQMRFKIVTLRFLGGGIKDEGEEEQKK